MAGSQLPGGQRDVEVCEVVAAGHDDGRGAVSMSASRRRPGVQGIADHEAGHRARPGPPRRRPSARDGDDLLVAAAQLVDRPQAEVVDAADDDVAVARARMRGPSIGACRAWPAVYGPRQVRYHPRPVGP